MEAHEAWFNSYSEGHEDWDEFVSASFKLVHDHGPALLALVDAEPVAWVYVPDGEQDAPGYSGYSFHGKKKLPAGRHLLYARPEARYLSPDEDRALRRAAVRGMTMLDEDASHE